MEPAKYKRPVIVGIFVFIGLVILVAAVFTLGGQKSTFEKKISIKAVFDNVNGLTVGDNVWLSGVKVGVVKYIDFADNGEVLITMSIEEKVKKLVHKDSKVKISSEGLMGNRIIVIYEGTSQSPLATGDDYLLSETSTDKKNLLETLETSNRNLRVITENLKEISNKMLNGKGAIAALLDDSTIVRNLRYGAANLKYAIANFRSVSVQGETVLKNLVDFSSQLNKQGTLVNDLITDTVVFSQLKESVAQLKSAADTISVFSQNIGKAGAALNKENNIASVLLYDDTTALHLKAIIANLDSASYTLNEDLEALQHSVLLKGYFKKSKKPQ